MKAEFREVTGAAAVNRSGEKELIAGWQVVAREGGHDGRLRVLVNARCWQSRSADGASPVYASVWVFGAERPISGSGVASGYGYHKVSAAMAQALRAAGVRLWEGEGDGMHRAEIDGCGEQAVEEALLAVGRALGLGEVGLVGF